MKYLTSVDDEMDETANSEGDPAPASLGVGYAGELAVEVGKAGNE